MADVAHFHALQYMNRLPESRRSEFFMVYQAQCKSRGVALLLSIFLGGLGVDRFYLGHVWLGLAKLFLNWWTCFLWALVDLFFIMGAADRYNFELVERLKTLYPADGSSPSGDYGAVLQALADGTVPRDLPE